MLDFSKLKEFAKQEDRIAAVGSEGTLSYRELYESVENLKSFIRGLSDDRSPILVIGDKENLLLAGIFAVVFSGHPYVAVTPSYPYSRIVDIEKSCSPCAVLNFSSKDFGSTEEHWYNADFLAEVAAKKPAAELPNAEWHDDDVMAIFYTSGSSGKPKGVKITYANMSCSMDKRAWIFEYCGLTRPEQPVVLNFSSYGFIASVSQLFVDISIYGSRLYAIGRDLLSDYKRLMNYIRDVNPTHYVCTPAFISMCLKDKDFSSDSLDRLQFIISGGAELPKSTAAEFGRRFPNTHLLNVYGSTEVCGSGLIYDCHDGDVDGDGAVSSGECYPFTEAYVADENGNELPDGEIGELRIISPSVSAGYYDSDRDPFFYTADGKRGFCSGDLFKRENGLLYYEGRIDSLVKLGGYRVETFDVERNLAACDMVKACVVSPCSKDGEVKLLTAFVVLNDGVEPGIKTTAAIKKQLREKIQHYAVPQRFVYLDVLPLNYNNKVDRVALKKRATDEYLGK